MINVTAAEKAPEVFKLIGDTAISAGISMTSLIFSITQLVIALIAGLYAMCVWQDRKGRKNKN